MIGIGVYTLFGETVYREGPSSYGNKRETTPYDNEFKDYFEKRFANFTIDNQRFVVASNQDPLVRIVTVIIPIYAVY